MNITQKQADWILGCLSKEKINGWSPYSLGGPTQYVDIDVIKKVLNCVCVNAIPEEGLVLRLGAPIENIIMPSLYIILIPPSNRYKNPRICVETGGEKEFCFSLNMCELKQFRTNIDKMINHLESKR